MAYLGKGLNDIATANIVVDTMTGNGSDTTLALSWGAGSKGIGSVNDVSVFYGGCQQRPGQDFTLANGTVTFTTAPMNGVNVVAVSHGDSWQDNVADSTVVTESFADLAITNAKIIGLDSSKLSGAMPAIDGSALTGITETTNSASDPATDTNGTLGDIWVNTASGEMFILTDATAGSNVWTNVGAGTGDVTFYRFQGTVSGYSAGGGPAPGSLTNVIEKFSLSTDSNSSDIADLSLARSDTAGHVSGTHGYTAGGYDGGLRDVIDKFPFASDTNATDVGNVTVARYGLTGSSSSTHGYSSGGDINGSGANSNIIDKHSFAVDSNATDVGDLTITKRASAGHSSVTHGYNAGSRPTNNTIDKWPFASDTNATDVGDLTLSRTYPAGQSSTTHGYSSGGNSGSYNDRIDKFTFATDADATDVGNLTTGRHGTAGHQY